MPPARRLRQDGGRGVGPTRRNDAHNPSRATPPASYLHCASLLVLGVFRVKFSREFFAENIKKTFEWLERGPGPTTRVLEQFAGSVCRLEQFAAHPQQTRVYLATPRVRQAVRRQFNCSHTPGAEIENGVTGQFRLKKRCELPPPSFLPDKILRGLRGLMD